MQSDLIRSRPNGTTSPSAAWRKPVRRGLALGIASFLLLIACSRQEEGDRCSTENDDLDCESGLICVPARNLRASDEVSRCCPPEGEPVSDRRCARLIDGSGGSGGADGGGNNLGGQAGGSSSATTTAGKTCDYNSDCPQGLVCGPSGVCQVECQADRDCEAPLVCKSGRCVEE